ncbi:MAG: HEPN domain-containing protein [Bacteroidales bacterium]|nr:HEPN domain-containing protein [Bacteroidales bacterium]
MRLDEEERAAIVKIRLQQSRETYAEIGILIDNKLWRFAANRLYYACYYAAQALMIQNGHQAKTHSGLVGLFGLHFVKTGKIKDDTASALQALFDLRLKGDYDVWVDVKPEMVLSLVEPAKNFIETIEKFILEN